MKRPQKVQPNSAADRILKAVLDAAERLGSDGKGRGGLSGYLRSLAKNHPAQFVPLLAKILDFEPSIEVAPKVLRTVEEIEADMKARGLPIPPKELLFKLWPASFASEELPPSSGL